MPRRKRVPKEVAELYRKAAHIYEKNKDFHLAVDLYAYIDDEEKVKEVCKKAEEMCGDPRWAALYLKTIGDEKCVAKAEKIVNGLVELYTAKGNLYDAAAITEEFLGRKKAAPLFLKAAKSAERAVREYEYDRTQLSRKIDSNREIAKNAYKKAGRYKKRKEILTAELKECEQYRYPLLQAAEVAEELGLQDRANEIYRQNAQMMEEWANGGKAIFPWSFLGVAASFFKKAGDEKNARRIGKKAARLAEKRGEKRWAVGAYVRADDIENAVRITHGLIWEARKKNDLATLGDRLTDLSSLTNDRGYLEEAKSAYFHFIEKHKEEKDKETMESVAFAYRKIAYILEGDPISWF